ncbi:MULTISPECIES: hypothetical protein [unclassified Streptomyces]|uniref:hypothetical protein n=1 Tax=unclassified Streptomyces TaxID=2593676 RepID=UPI00081F2357|nr:MULTISPECIES: hypothetical protein [unclassified Streptomyces]MYR95444.1 hypothetical protein [Streptomyces sp. SID4937]SCD90459.1 hypothetical protein GA0115243_104723 [Streptomyces sp. ScaeMP-e83]
MTIKAELTKKTRVEETVTLTLSKEAAEVLTAIFVKVSGSRENSYRRYTEEMYTALVNAGVQGYSNLHNGVHHPYERLEGGISFRAGFGDKGKPKTAPRNLYTF